MEVLQCYNPHFTERLLVIQVLQWVLQRRYESATFEFS
jgi:hypothetical protein